LIIAPDVTVKFDLFSLNIQRGRDHGVPGYNAVRKAYGLGPIADFRSFNKGYKADNLTKLYTTPDNMDLFVGIIGEESLSDGQLGDLGAKIVSEQFKNLRNSDRYWY
jgi:peroxidase